MNTGGTLVVAGYPKFFQTNTDKPAWTKKTSRKGDYICAVGSLGLKRYRIGLQDAKEINAAVVKVNNLIRSEVDVAQRSVRALPGMQTQRIVYAPVDFSASHRLCGESTQFLNSVLPDKSARKPKNQSLHPNAAGQAEYKADVLLKVPR
jgi:hypothetical protein